MNQLKFEMNSFLIAAIERLMDSGELVNEVIDDFIKTMNKLDAEAIQNKVMAAADVLKTSNYKPVITGGDIAAMYVTLAKEMLAEVEKHNAE